MLPPKGSLVLLSADTKTLLKSIRQVLGHVQCIGCVHACLLTWGWVVGGAAVEVKRAARCQHGRFIDSACVVSQSAT